MFPDELNALVSDYAGSRHPRAKLLSILTGESNSALKNDLAKSWKQIVQSTPLEDRDRACEFFLRNIENSLKEADYEGLANERRKELVNQINHAANALISGLKEAGLDIHLITPRTPQKAVRDRLRGITVYEDLEEHDRREVMVSESSDGRSSFNFLLDELGDTYLDCLSPDALLFTDLTKRISKRAQDRLLAVSTAKQVTNRAAIRFIILLSVAINSRFGFNLPNLVSVFTTAIFPETNYDRSDVSKLYSLAKKRRLRGKIQG